VSEAAEVTSRIADVSMELPVTVVGDVHLSAAEPAVAERFARFLARVEGGGGTLVLLGDLFDWWAGRGQAARPFESSVIEGLRRVRASGVRLAFVAGNRDFLFDGCEGLDLELWPEVVRTRWGERTVLLTHGDLLCSADRPYLAMRRLLRSALIRTGAHALPFRVKANLAQGIRAYSERTGRHSPGARRGIDYGIALEWMRRAGADVLVAGHVHTGVHHRLPGEPPRDVYVLKDWDRTGGVVVFDGERILLTPP
jgi:UDP-2,3-diacylglucosamine hydrolase